MKLLTENQKELFFELLDIIPSDYENFDLTKRYKIGDFVGDDGPIKVDVIKYINETAPVLRILKKVKAWDTNDVKYEDKKKELTSILLEYLKS